MCIRTRLRSQRSQLLANSNNPINLKRYQSNNKDTFRQLVDFVYTPFPIRELNHPLETSRNVFETRIPRLHHREWMRSFPSKTQKEDVECFQELQRTNLNNLVRDRHHTCQQRVGKTPGLSNASIPCVLEVKEHQFYVVKQKRPDTIPCLAVKL